MTATTHPAFASHLRPPQSVEPLTSAMIAALRREAALAGDTETVALCDDRSDDERLAEIISDARALHADDGREPWIGVVAE